MGRDGGKHWDNKLAIIGGLSAPPSRGADAGYVRYKEGVSPTTPHLSMGAACRLLGRCTGSSPATTWFSVAPCHQQELSSSATVTGCGRKGKTSIKKTLEHDKQSFRYEAVRHSRSQRWPSRKGLRTLSIEPDTGGYNPICRHRAMELGVPRWVWGCLEGTFGTQRARLIVSPTLSTSRGLSPGGRPTSDKCPILKGHPAGPQRAFCPSSEGGRGYLQRKSPARPSGFLN